MIFFCLIKPRFSPGLLKQKWLPPPQTKSISTFLKHHISQLFVKHLHRTWILRNRKQISTRFPGKRTAILPLKHSGIRRRSGEFLGVFFFSCFLVFFWSKLIWILSFEIHSLKRKAKHAEKNRWYQREAILLNLFGVQTAFFIFRGWLC